ncbi:MAG: hypothetical protein GX573_18205 [Chloroflexi bacterium]|nr:hypothetical protein [Chloroflexota bacterium]
MDNRTLLANAYIVWFVAASLLTAIALAMAFEDEPLWLWILFLIAYVSLVRGAACWFCKRRREILGRS